MRKKQKIGRTVTPSETYKNESTIPMGIVITIIALITFILIAAVTLLGIIMVSVFEKATSQNINLVDKNTFNNDDGIDAIFLNGVWEIESPVNSGEITTIAFWDNSISMITEIEIADANYKQLLETIDETKEFYKNQNGAIAEIMENEEGKTLLCITLDGAFLLTENEIIISSGQDILTVLPFAEEGNNIYIDNECYLRKSHFLPESEK